MYTSVCHIVGALPLPEHAALRIEPGDLLIAADRGYESVVRLGLAPDLVVGDFDSLGAPPDDAPVLKLPRIKDETDVGYALNVALDRGFRRFLIYGALGGRTDHTLANLQLLAGLSARGGAGVLAGDGQYAAAVTDGALSFPAGLAGRVSVFCNSGTARGVTLSGLRYPLDRHTLTGDFPLGVSNEFLGAPARVSVEAGTLLVLWEDDRADLRALLG